MSLLIVGCGYVGWELVRRLHSPATGDPQTIYVLTRSPERAEQLSRQGLQPLVGHWLKSATLPAAPRVSRVLISVPHRADPEAGELETSDQCHVLGLQNLCEWLAPTGWAKQPHRLIYLSTTGVFGSSESGQRVTEESPVSPTRQGPQIAVAAEDWLQRSREQLSSVVLRLAGIYGPGRVPLIQALKTGQPLAVPRHGLLNLIHVADAAQAIAWLLNAKSPQRLYLLSDGQPVPRENFYRYLAACCGVAEPQFVEAEQNDSRSRRSTDKHVDSQLFWRDSGLQPLFPDYRAGLKTALEENQK